MRARHRTAAEPGSAPEGFTTGYQTPAPLVAIYRLLAQTRA